MLGLALQVTHPEFDERITVNGLRTLGFFTIHNADSEDRNACQNQSALHKAGWPG